MPSQISCPCQSGLSFKDCCQPYLLRTSTATSAEILMRSRYSAYYYQNAEYLFATWRPSAPHSIDIETIKASFADTRWLGLKILKAIADPHNTYQYFLEFIAYYQQISTLECHILYERSRFHSINNEWFYVDGIFPVIKRNAPCLCGSGKKYKHCQHGLNDYLSQ